MVQAGVSVSPRSHFSMVFSQTRGIIGLYTKDKLISTWSPDSFFFEILSEATEILGTHETIKEPKQFRIIDNKTGFLWGKLIKKDLFLSLPVVPTDMKFCEDLIQMLQLSYRAKEVRHCQAPTYEYYQTVNSACNALLPRNEYAHRFYQLCHYITLLSACNEYTEQAQSRLKAMFLYYCRLYLWVNGHWSKNDVNIKKQYKMYISENDVMKDYILQGHRGILTRLAAYLAPLFSIGYVFLLRHKYHRIK